jgi:2Fe-2S ferredoxin
MYTIRINFEQEGLGAVLLTNVEDGYSLLEILHKNDLELHQDCGGICACSTCHVYIDKGNEFIRKPEVREKNFLEMVIFPGPGSRLGCQCLLEEGRGEIEITIPNQNKIGSLT